MIKTFTIKDIENWENTAKSFSMYDIYFSPNYFIPFMNNGDGSPTAFYYEGSYGRVFHSFLKRDISEFPRFQKEIEKSTYFDISTVYGYGGPIYECEEKNLEKLSKEFYERFQQYCSEENIISEFLRFHPMMGNEIFSKDHVAIENIRKTVCIDLSKGMDYVWKKFSSTARNRIRKAENSGLIVHNGITDTYITAFTDLYNKTMKKNHADSYYYFNDNFFKDSINYLKDNSNLFIATYNEKIVAATIIVYSDNYVHYHFSCSDPEHATLPSTDLIIYSIINWAIKKGMKSLHLGGGHEDSNDSLYRFKKKFTKDEALNFYIGKKIYDKKAYDWLVSKTLDYNDMTKNSNYFPCYRKLP